MFDDPKKQLEHLQEQLLAAELPEPAAEGPELEEDLEDLKELLDTDDWEGTHRKPLYQSYTPPGCEDDDADAYTDNGEEVPQEPEAPKKGVAGLVAALILETIALVGVVIWWVMK